MVWGYKSGRFWTPEAPSGYKSGKVLRVQTGVMAIGPLRGYAGVLVLTGIQTGHGHVILTYIRPNESHQTLVRSSGTAGSNSAVTAVTNFLLARSAFTRVGERDYLDIYSLGLRLGPPILLACPNAYGG